LSDYSQRQRLEREALNLAAGVYHRSAKMIALGVLAQVQRKHPIGLMVLESKIAGCEAAGHTLISGVKLKMIALGLSQATAAALELY
jgi:hypothetical protein